MAKTQLKKPSVVEIGDRVKFDIDGFQGIVTSRHDFFTGPLMFGISSESPKTAKDDRIRQLDADLLIVIKKGVKKAKPPMPCAVVLGDRVQDCVSSFKGIATGKHTYIQGCLQFSITIEDRKTKEDDAIRAFDGGRLTIVNKQAVSVPESAPTGGPERYIPAARQ